MSRHDKASANSCDCFESVKCQRKKTPHQTNKLVSRTLLTWLTPHMICVKACVSTYLLLLTLFTHFLATLYIYWPIIVQASPQQHLVTNVLIYDEGHCRIWTYHSLPLSYGYYRPVWVEPTPLTRETNTPDQSMRGDLLLSLHTAAIICIMEQIQYH